MSEKPKKKPTSLKVWFVRLVVLPLIVFFSLFLWLRHAVSKIDLTGDSSELRGAEAHDFIVERFFPTPHDAKDFYLRYYSDWQDFSANIRFSASPESVEAWLNGHDFCFTELSNTPFFGYSGGALDWWQPNINQDVVSSEECGNNPYYQFGIDQNDPELWIIYLVIFST